MKKVYFTITGTKYRYGQEFLKPGMKVKLEKEPDNQYDSEAIRVTQKGLGHIGYVANSAHIVKGESWSAGRIYDRIGKKASGTVKLVLPDGVLCKLEKERNKWLEVAGIGCQFQLSVRCEGLEH